MPGDLKGSTGLINNTLGGEVYRGKITVKTNFDD